MKLIIFIALLAYVEVYAGLESLREMVNSGNVDLDLFNYKIFNLINGLDNSIAHTILEQQRVFFKQSITQYLSTLTPMLSHQTALSRFSIGILNNLVNRVNEVFNSENPSSAQNLRTKFFDATKAFIELTKLHAEAHMMDATPMAQEWIELMVKQAVDISKDRAMYLETALIAAKNPY